MPINLPRKKSVSPPPPPPPWPPPECTCNVDFARCMDITEGIINYLIRENIVDIGDIANRKDIVDNISKGVLNILCNGFARY